MRALALAPLLILPPLLFTAPVEAKSSLKMTVKVAPNPVKDGSYATLTVKTKPGYACAAFVIDSNGKVPPSFGKYLDAAHNPKAYLVPASGVRAWTWRVQGKISGGTATVVCASSATTTHSVSVLFTVTH